MLTSETKTRINACRDILVGKLPLPTDQVELITLALIYKFMDDLDEESVSMGGKRSFFTGHLEPYRWRNLLPQTVSAEQRMSLFARGIELLGGADMEVEVKEKGQTKKSPHRSRRASAGAVPRCLPQCLPEVPRRAHFDDVSHGGKRLRLQPQRGVGERL